MPRNAAREVVERIVEEEADLAVQFLQAMSPNYSLLRPDSAEAACMSIWCRCNGHAGAMPRAISMAPARAIAAGARRRANRPPRGARRPEATQMTLTAGMVPRPNAIMNNTADARLPDASATANAA